MSLLLGLKYAVIIGVLSTFGFKWWQADDYRKKYIVSQDRLKQSEAVIDKMVRTNAGLHKSIDDDRKMKEIDDEKYTKVLESYAALKLKSKAVVKFVSITIPDNLNHWMHSKYGKACKSDRGKNTQCIFKRNKASRVVNDLIVFIGKYHKALTSCNRDKALIRGLQANTR